MEQLNDIAVLKDDSGNIFVLTERQIKLLKEEMKNLRENPDSYTDWEIVQKQIDWDAC